MAPSRLFCVFFGVVLLWRPACVFADQQDALDQLKTLDKNKGNKSRYRAMYDADAPDPNFKPATSAQGGAAASNLNPNTKYSGRRRPISAYGSNISNFEPPAVPPPKEVSYSYNPYKVYAASGPAAGPPPPTPTYDKSAVLGALAGGLIGALIGFAIGGPIGAIIGFLIGVLLGAAFAKLMGAWLSRRR